MLRPTSSPDNPAPRTLAISLQKVSGSAYRQEEDWVVVEEPLEIRLGHPHPRDPATRVRQSLSITMRTPGDDRALAVGFLLSEGIIHHRDDIENISFCGPQNPPGDEPGEGQAWPNQFPTSPHPLHSNSNIIRVDLRPHVALDMKKLQRHFYTTSSCGVCGKTSLEALQVQVPWRLSSPHPVFPASLLHELPEKVRQHQSLFQQTGGLHAAALFNSQGELVSVCEDVGRHNAFDKLIGHQVLADHLPLSECLVFVSGRASFELMQKALMAGLPFLAAVGAPSGLCVQLAQAFDMTLVGFLRQGQFNIYHGGQRIRF